MRPLGEQLVLAVPRSGTPSSVDTTSTATVRYMHYHHGWPRIVGGVIWLAIMIYVLWLGTRIVRAIERLADKFQSRAP